VRAALTSHVLRFPFHEKTAHTNVDGCSERRRRRSLT
jgi:hypothetical protein